MSAWKSLGTPLLEQIRSKHEEIQRLEQLIMKDLMKEELSPMEQLSQGRRLRSMTKSIILKTEKLVKTYEEKKDAIAAPLGDETEIWTAFCNRLDEIHEYHGKHPSEPLVDSDYKELLVDAADYGAPLEAKVEKLCNLLDETIKRIFEDMEKEKPMEQAMGWDGKPIPYWLNQLGLGQEYKCEICRNRSYWGKTALERHFQEWRHLWALGCLGILDREKKFIRITSFEEVKQLKKSQGGQCKDVEEIFKEKKSNHDLGYELKISFPTPYSYYSGDDAEDEFLNPPMPLEPHKFTYRLPEGITVKELDMIKLAAEFWARYGRRFSVGFRKKMVNNPYFEFMNKPTEGRCTLFGEFLSAYVEVLIIPPFEVLKEKLRKNAADMETILENCYHRLQWNRFVRDRIVKKARKE